MPPRRAWRKPTLRKLGEGSGGPRGRAETQGSPQAHARARTGTHTTTLHTCPLHTLRLGEGITGRSRRQGLAVSPAAPLQRLAQQAAAPAGPAQPRQGAALGEWGKRGVSPAAPRAEGRGGARPWGRGRSAYKIALRTGINKPCQATLAL